MSLVTSTPTIKVVAVCKDYAAPTGLCPSPIGWDLSRLGSDERNLAKPKAREGRASGRERVIGWRSGVRVLIWFVVLQRCRAYGAAESANRHCR
jgi:hypothetical protein